MPQFLQDIVINCDVLQGIRHFDIQIVRSGFGGSLLQYPIFHRYRDVSSYRYVYGHSGISENVLIVFSYQ